MADSDAQKMSNLKLSSDVIVFSPQTQTAQLALTNLHQTYSIYFKVIQLSLRSKLK
jgi:hypothetical protein